MADKAPDQKSLKKLGSLWKQRSKGGLDYFQGKIAPEAVLDNVMLTPGSKIVMFKAESTNPKAPVYNVFIQAPEKDEKDGDVPF